MCLYKKFYAFTIKKKISINFFFREIPAATSSPGKAITEKEEIKHKTEVEAFPDKRQLLKADSHPPAGYSQNPDSFRKYLLSIKKQSKNFGYAASVIDDHLQRLDDVRYHTFNRKVLLSENDIHNM